MTNQEAISYLELIRICDAPNVSEALSMAIEALSAQPEIIRCKDCEDYQTDWETSYPDRHYCATMDSTMPEDGFCSYAERKDNG